MAVRFHKSITLAPGVHGDISVGALARIHEGTPDPQTPPQFQVPKFAEPRPAAPAARRAAWWERLVPGSAERIARHNQRAAALHHEDMDDWFTAKRAHDLDAARRKARFENRLQRDPAAMEQALETALHGVAWPRETEVAFEIRNDGALVMLDVQIDGPAGSHWQPVHMAALHAIAFRLIGEAFAALPAAREVILSAYARVPEAAADADDAACLLSARVDRFDWQAIDFARLRGIVVVEALSRFELRRSTRRSGEFKPVSPLEA